MNKRLILAIGLSFLIMVIWARLAEKFYPIERQEVTEKSLEPAPTFIPSEEKETETLISAISHNRELVFSLPGACLKKVNFSQYADYEVSLEQGFCLAEQDLVFTQERLDSEEAIFVHQDGQKRITKQFNYSDPNFIITLDIKIENLSEQSLSYPSGLILRTINLSSQQFKNRLREVFLKQPDRILRLNPGKETKIQHSGEFFGFRDNYFCAIIIPMSFPEMLQVVRIDRATSQLGLSRPDDRTFAQPDWAFTILYLSWSPAGRTIKSI